MHVGFDAGKLRGNLFIAKIAVSTQQQFMAV